jgi:hypothetical protein
MDRFLELYESIKACIKLSVKLGFFVRFKTHLTHTDFYFVKDGRKFGDIVIAKRIKQVNEKHINYLSKNIMMRFLAYLIEQDKENEIYKGGINLNSILIHYKHRNFVVMFSYQQDVRVFHFVEIEGKKEEVIKQLEEYNARQLARNNN